MLEVHELIDNLRRFPQSARVLCIGGKIVVGTYPHGRDGKFYFDACCPDKDVPYILKKSAEN